MMIEQAKAEVAKAHPDWVRQWPELFLKRKRQAIADPPTDDDLTSVALL
jgi:hypothetical protein